MSNASAALSDDDATIAFISVQPTGFVIHVINSMQLIGMKQNQNARHEINQMKQI